MCVWCVCLKNDQENNCNNQQYAGDPTFWVWAQWHHVTMVCLILSVLIFFLSVYLQDALIQTYISWKCLLLGISALTFIFNHVLFYFTPAKAVSEQWCKSRRQSHPSGAMWKKEEIDYEHSVKAFTGWSQVLSFGNMFRE